MGWGGVGWGGVGGGVGGGRRVEGVSGMELKQLKISRIKYK